MLGIYTDITLRKKDEKALRESEERFRTAFQANPDPTALVCLSDGTVTDINEGFCLFFGYEKQEVVGKEAASLSIFESAEERADFYRDLEADGEVLNREFQLLYRGEERTHLVSGRVVHFGGVPHAYLVARDITRIKKTEEALLSHERELEETTRRLRLMVERMPLGCIVCDTDFRVILWNPAAEKIFGFGEAEALGRHPFEFLVPPEMQAQGEHLFEQIVGGDTTAHSINENETSDGRTIICEWHNTPMRESSGKVIAVLSMVQDVTSRQEAEKRVMESEERFRTVFQTSPNSLVIARLSDGAIVAANDSLTAITGYSREEVIGKNSLELGLWADLADRDRMYHLLKRDGQVTDMEARFLHKDGSEATGLFSVRLIQLGGEPHLLSVGRDISEVKNAQLALEKSEHEYRILSQQFQTLLDGIPDVLILFDPELKIVWANKGAMEQFRDRLGELAGKCCCDLWGCDPRLCDGCLPNTFATGKTQERLHRTDDDQIWGVKVFPIKDAQGRVVNAIQIASDLTEKIRLREDANRTSRLAALGEIASGVAHEINNPNGMILINLGMLSQVLEESRPILDRHFEEQGDFPWGGIKYSRTREEIPRLVEEMRDAAQRIKYTVEELKGFSRRDLEKDFVAVDLNNCVENALRLAAVELEQACAIVKTKLARELPAVRGVSQRLEQILVNLLSNACQALRDRDRTIEVTTRRHPAGKQVTVVVRDRGVGIAPKHLERLTDPFFTTRRQLGGTGLGLALSARMAKEHGGGLEFDSTLGEGTTVTLTLPIPEKRKP